MIDFIKQHKIRSIILLAICSLLLFYLIPPSWLGWHDIVPEQWTENRVYYDGSKAFYRASDGSLYGWGYDYFGGISGNMRQKRAAKKIFSDVKGFASGLYCTLGIRSDGALYSFGTEARNARTEYSPEVTDSPQLFLMNDVISVDVGEVYYLALTEDGVVRRWSYDATKSDGEQMTEKIMDNCVDIFSHKYIYGAITADGEVYIWGEPDGVPLIAKERIATGISKVACINDNRYQLLTTDGELLEYDIERDRGIPTEELRVLTCNVAGICDYGYLLVDGTFWRWVEHGADTIEAVCIGENVVSANADNTFTVLLKDSGTLQYFDGEKMQFEYKTNDFAFNRWMFNRFVKLLEILT